MIARKRPSRCAAAGKQNESGGSIHCRSTLHAQHSMRSHSTLPNTAAATGNDTWPSAQRSAAQHAHLLDEDLPQPRLAKGVVLQVELVKTGGSGSRRIMGWGRGRLVQEGLHTQSTPPTWVIYRGSAWVGQACPRRGKHCPSPLTGGRCSCRRARPGCRR